MRRTPSAAVRAAATTIVELYTHLGGTHASFSSSYSLFDSPACHSPCRFYSSAEGKREGGGGGGDRQHCQSRQQNECRQTRETARPLPSTVPASSPSSSSSSSLFPAVTDVVSLEREVGRLTGARDARGAVACVSESLQRKRLFSWKALASALHAAGGEDDGRRSSIVATATSAAASAAAAGLSLLREVWADPAAGAPPTHPRWRSEERLLFCVLRLYCVAGNTADARRLFQFMLQSAEPLGGNSGDAHQGQHSRGGAPGGERAGSGARTPEIARTPPPPPPPLPNSSLLRLRSASLFLRFCCDAGDVAWAAAVYRECRRRGIVFSPEDYASLAALYLDPLRHPGRDASAASPPDCCCCPQTLSEEGGEACSGSSSGSGGGTAAWVAKSREAQSRLCRLLCDMRADDVRMPVPRSFVDRVLCLSNSVDTPPPPPSSLASPPPAAVVAERQLQQKCAYPHRPCGKGRDTYAPVAFLCNPTPVPMREETDEVPPPSISAEGTACENAHQTAERGDEAASSSAAERDGRRQHVCSHCHTPFAGRPFTQATKTQLLSDITALASQRYGGKHPSAAASLSSHTTQQPQNQDSHYHHHRNGAQRHARAANMFSAWKRFIEERAHVPYDIIIDGANIGYYGLSSRPGTSGCGGGATGEGRTADGEAAAGRAPGDTTGTVRRSRSSSSSSTTRALHTRLPVDYALIEAALQGALARGFRRPLILLHQRHADFTRHHRSGSNNYHHHHCSSSSSRSSDNNSNASKNYRGGGHNGAKHEQEEEEEEFADGTDSPAVAEAERLVRGWRERGQLFLYPAGMYDDLGWLYAAVRLTPTTEEESDGISADERVAHASASLPSSAVKEGKRKEDKQRISDSCRSFASDSASAKHPDAGDITTTTTTTAATSNQCRHSCYHHRRDCGTWVLSNDLLRDHSFRVSQAAALSRWREEHCIGFNCRRVPLACVPSPSLVSHSSPHSVSAPSPAAPTAATAVAETLPAHETQTVPELLWRWPPPYATCLQLTRCSASPTGAAAQSESKTNVAAAGAYYYRWHLPFYDDDDTSETQERSSGDGPKAKGKEANDAQRSEGRRVRWVCFTTPPPVDHI